MKYMQKSPLKSAAVQDVIRNCAKIHTLEMNEVLCEVTTTNSAFIVRSGSLMIFRYECELVFEIFVSLFLKQGISSMEGNQ
jgi:hypothetical protein